MTRNIYTNNLQNTWQERQNIVVQTVELVVFDIGELSFGLSISKVDRIVDLTNNSKDFGGLENVRVLDLHQQLFDPLLTQPAAWVIVKDLDRLAYRIAVDTIPTLILVPLDRIRTIPSELRTASPLGIASHVAMIAEADRELTIFILAE
jgi:hypothetical protein